MWILGIESSCDETGVALVRSEAGGGLPQLVSQALHTQAAMHEAYGGVVPELASRDHIRRVLPLIQQVMQQAQLPLADLDVVAYTRGPGLAGALLVGAGTACALAASLGIPLLGVHHLEGHLLAPFMGADPPTFPFVALLVSGGHTQLMHCQGLGQYELLGESLDDAAGEAFDKVAKMLGLAYPGGPAIEALARLGQADRFRFPRPMTDRPGLDFSFSGLKTFTMNTLKNIAAPSDQDKADIALAFQTAVTDTIRIKCRRAAEQTGLNQMVIAGGVSANQALRQTLQLMTRETGCQVFYPALKLCTDNGAMIAYAGLQHLLKGYGESLEIVVRPRWPMTELG